MGAMFVNPLMLFGAAAIAAPIILFLLTRFRTKRVEWAAIIFLQRAMKKQQRRLRLENLILLLIRCLLLILLALALARPTTSQRFGPTVFLPPLATVWHDLHFLNNLAPLSGVAEASMVMAFSMTAAAPPLAGAASAMATA